MFSSEFRKVFKSTYFVNVCKRLLLKIKGLIRVSFIKASGFCYKQNNGMFTMKELRDKLAWKFLNVFYSFLANKNVFKIGDKKLIIELLRLM